MSKVIIKKCETYDFDLMSQAIKSGMDLLGGWENFVKPGMKVLLKVNMIGPKTSESAAVTHCELARVIVRMLRERHCIVSIGDSS
ncbi:MAG: iron-sulfur cluster-binding protein, partial [Clostridiales bacterium]|nr:iron-sulfur cluster-binding protein [Clostridiales bacterium]